MSFTINNDIKKVKIKEKNYDNDGITYKIINYDKNYISYNDTEIFKYRSIILSIPENQLMSFSPPKSLHYNTFIIENPVINEFIYVNEYIEGIMINLFYDNRSNKWEIATKSAIGGNYNYYYYDKCNYKRIDKTFHQMFMDAFSLDNKHLISDIFILDELCKNHCYSFVLQHPDNHIVLNITKPRIYLVAVYNIINENSVKTIPMNEVENWNCFSSGIIKFPKKIHFESYIELKNRIDNIQNNPYMVGVMITNLKTGNRTKIENPIYNQKKLLLGNKPNLLYQYLCLYRIHKINDFLLYFPRYKKAFNNFFNDYNELITNVHISYLNYYVKKTDFRISKQYMPHILKIHTELYLPSIKTKFPTIIRRNTVKKYFDKLEPRELLYHINYRIRETDFIQNT